MNSIHFLRKERYGLGGSFKKRGVLNPIHELSFEIHFDSLAVVSEETSQLACLGKALPLHFLGTIKLNGLRKGIYSSNYQSCSLY